jgi:hypothetical protein
MKMFLLGLKVITSFSMAVVMIEKALVVARKAVQYVIGLFSAKSQQVNTLKVYGC